MANNMLNLELLANRRARRNRNNAIRAGQMGTAMNPGVASALPDTLTMRVGENLGQYFKALRNLAFPDFNKYLSATGDFLMEPSEQMASQMARGEPNVPFNRLPNTSNINPALVDTIGLLPVATVAKAPSVTIPAAAIALNKSVEGLLGISDAVKKAQAEAPSVVEGLLTASIGQKPEMQSLIFTGERSGLADSDRTIRERFLKAQMMSEETPSKYRDEQIFKETGLERGADGLFRLEISDDTAKVSLPDYMTGEQIQSKLDKYNARLKELSEEMKQYEKFPGSYRQFNDPKGVELAEQYEEILTQRGQLPQRPEIETTLGEVLDHPTLYQAYPELAEYKLRILPEGAEGGFFDQKNKTIQISGRDKEFLESSLLHEVQHGVQRLEDFAIGGNPDASSFLEIEAAKAQVREARNRFEKNTKQASYDFRTNRDAAKVRLNLLDQINDIVGYENISAPRFLFNTGEWYKYSDEISRELGKMPSRNPKKRQWIEQAGQMIANRKLNELMAYSPGAGQESIDKLLNQVNYYRRNRKELKNALRRAEYGYKKYFMSDAGRAYTDAVRAESKVNELKRLDSIKQEDRSGKDFERYQKLGGEVEARNVERRRKMTPEERQQTRGLLTEDVPRDEQILLRPSVYAEGRKTSSLLDKARSIPDSLPMDEASRLQRAKEMGFGEELYHGTVADIDEFEVSDLGVHLGTQDAANVRLSDKEATRLGVSRYKTRNQNFGKNANVLPVRTSVQNPLRMDDAGEWRDPSSVITELRTSELMSKNPKLHERLLDMQDEADKLHESYASGDLGSEGWYESPEASEMLDEIRKMIEAEGYDSIVYTNFIESRGKDADSIIVLNPKNIRSRYAKFDPAKKDSAKILASTVPVISGAGLLSGQQDNNNATTSGAGLLGVR